MDLANAESLGFDVSRLEYLRQAMRDDMVSAGVDGVSLIIGRHGHIAFEMIEGLADRSSGRMLDRNSVFATFAVSKHLVAVVALRFVEKGLLHLHQPIAELLPVFRVPDKQKINLFHLLSYTSGIYSPYPDSLPYEDLGNIDKVTAFAANKPLEAMPGERCSYSMFAVHAVIASLCVAADGGNRSFAQIMTDELFEPAGMKDSNLGPRDDLVSRFCAIRTNFDDDFSVSPALLAGIEKLLLTPGNEMPGAGGLLTTSDLYRFADMLRNNGAIDGRRVLAPATIAYMTRVHSLPTMHNRMWDRTIAARNWTVSPANQGLGFWIRGEEGVPAGPIGSLMSPRAYGGFGAGSCGFWVDPEYDLAIAFTSTGLLRGYAHQERLGRLTNMIVASVVN